MKLFLKSAGLAVLAVLALGLVSCEAFTPDTLGLMSKTFIYYSNGGHNKETYVFDSSGKAGSFTKEYYSYAFSTAAQAASPGDGSAKTWRQTGGSKGTFTYDPASFDYTADISQYYTSAAGSSSFTQSDLLFNNATPQTNTYYTAYAWRTLADTWGSGYTSVASTVKSKLVFTTDSVEAYAYVNTSARVWTSTEVTTTNYTFSSGNTGSSESTRTESWDISATGLTRAYTYVSTSTSGSSITSSTSFTDWVYKVNQWFTKNETWAAEAFDTSWVDGKTLTFWVDMTLYGTGSYTNLTGKPSAPTTFVNGVGTSTLTNASGTSTWTINNTLVASSATFQNHGKYMLLKDSPANRQL